MLRSNSVFTYQSRCCPSCQAARRTSVSLLEVSAASFAIKESDLTFGQQIGSGSYGDVFDGRLFGTAIAIKRMHVGEIRASTLRAFHKECGLMRKLRHPNLVLFMGSCVKMPCTLLLVTELMTRGNLFEIYHQEPRLKKTSAHYKRVVDVSIDMCKGMCALHHCDPPLLHRDLKSPNIFVDQHWVAKIGDFGLAKMKSEGKTMTAGVGSPLWIAPEVLKGERFGEGCDIYSFAIILWEMAAWCEPYEGLNSVEVQARPSHRASAARASPPYSPARARYALAVLSLCSRCARPTHQVTRGVVRGMRPRVPDDCPAEIGELMEECWLEDHLARPPFDRVLDIFEKFARGIQQEGNFLPAAATDEEELANPGDSATLGAASDAVSGTALGAVPITASGPASGRASGAAPGTAEPQELTQREIRRRQQQQLEEERKKPSSKKKASRASPKIKPISSPKRTAAKTTVSAPQAALPPVREQRKHAAPKESRRGSVTEYPAHLDQWSV